MRRGRPSRQPIDSLIRRYHAGLAPGARLVEAEGRVYDKVCSACASVTRHWKESEEVWACGHCGAPWQFADVEVLKGEVGRRHRRGKSVRAVRVDDLDRAAVDLVDAAPIGVPLEQMHQDDYWRYPTQLLVLYALYMERYGDVARAANERRWPTRRGDPWTKETVRYWVRQARRELTRRIEERDRIACIMGAEHGALSF